MPLPDIRLKPEPAPSRLDAVLLTLYRWALGAALGALIAYCIML